MRGEVRYRLSLDSSQFQKGFKDAEKQIESTTQKAARMSQGFGQVTTTLARSTGALGLANKQAAALSDTLRNVGDASDIMELGFKNMSKSAVGFNTATLGVIGAGLALGTAIGTMARQFSVVEKAADSAGQAIFRFFTSQATLDRQALGNISQSQWRAQSGNTAENFAAGRQGRFNTLRSLGATPDQLRTSLLGGKGVEDPIEQQIKALDKVEKSSVRVAKAIDLMGQRMQRATDAADPFGDLLGVAASEAERSAAYLAGLPGESGFFGGSGLIPIPDIGAMPAPPGGRSGGFFGSALKMLGGAALGGLPGMGMVTGLVSGLVGKAFGGIKSLFGFGGPSKEEREAARKAEQDRQDRIRRGALASRAEGIGGLMEHGPAFFMAKGIGSAEEAERAGVQFVAAWSEVVKERGPAAAAEAFGGAFDKMRDEILGKGLALPAWMQSIQGQMGLGRNAAFAGVANTARTGASFLGALGSAGGLTGDVFRSFEQEARAAFAGGKAIAGGEGMADAEATKSGFAAANPLLKELVNQSVLGDHALSADIQEMVKAQGIVPDVEFQQLDELRAIRAAVTGLGGATPSSGGGSGGYSGGFAPGGDGIPGFAAGGYTAKGGLALLHPDEFVVPGHKMRSGGRGNISVTVNVGGTNATPDQITAAVEMGVRRVLRGGRSTIPQDLEKAGFVRRK